LLCLLLLFCLASATSAADVKFGIDVLRDDNFKQLDGKRVGLVANPASVDEHLVATADVLKRSPRVKLLALFGPEHGIYGNEYAGDKVPDRKDPDTGIPIYSLYGSTRKPTPEMLADLDVLVFDLQDIGSRSYTYISTMKVCMEACAENDKGFMILDRPNPLGGKRVEGPGTVEKGYESFVSFFSVPYVHGMTMGELAQLVNKQFYPDYKKLSVIKMTGWTRDTIWTDTGRDWIPTSPHLPHAKVAASYAATGILGELYVVSNGVGYTLPFDIVGAPWVNGVALEEALNAHWNNPREYYQRRAAGKPPKGMERSPGPAGVTFRAIHFKPFYATFAKEPCQGVQVHADMANAGTLVEINFRLLQALGAKEILDKAPKRHDMFDKVCGSDEPRRYLMEGRELEPLFAKWRQQCKAFEASRRPFLLY
jgi:uncharacterized protein YbbC (DUF1343 family)